MSAILLFIVYLFFIESYSVCVVSNKCGDQCLKDIENCIGGCSGKYCGIEIQSGSFDLYINGEQAGGYIQIPNKQNIDLYGASDGTTTLIIHGYHGIFDVYSSSNITIRNIVFDFHRYPYTYGQVTNVDKSSNQFTMKIDPDLYQYPPNPYLNDTQNYDFVYSLGSILGYDPINKHPIYPDIYTSGSSIKSTQQNEVIVVLGANQGGINDIVVNDYLILRHDAPYTAFQSNQCHDFTMQDITLYTCPGMAYFAAKTNNIHLNRVKFQKNDKYNRPLSTIADSAHLVYNTGNIIIENSVFNGQGDDGLNILNQFFQIDQVISSNSLKIQLTEANQDIKGSIIVGDVYEFRNRKTLQPYFSSKVTDMTDSNIITFADNVPTDLLTIYDVIVDITSLPTNVVIRNNQYSSNRARGTLLKVSNVSFINNTYIDITGPAIFIRPESAYWLEGTVSHNMFIQDNYIENCNFGIANENGTIMITATICGWDNNAPDRQGYPLQTGQVHRNFTIKNNVFNQTLDTNIQFHSAISIRAVNDFYIDNNTFLIPKADYPVMQKFNDAGTQQFDNNQCLIDSKVAQCQTS